MVVGGRQARQRKLEAAERARQRAEAEAARLEEERRKAIFTEEEQVKLAQAMKKFPPGTINRWEKISRCASRARAAKNLICPGCHGARVAVAGGWGRGR